MQLMLSTLTDRELVSCSLRQSGHSSFSAESKATVFNRTSRYLQASGLDDDAPCHAFFVPGRVELLGKHTDYAGGSSIVAAIEQGLCVVTVPRNEDCSTIHALDIDERVEFTLGTDLTVPKNHWSSYPITVARRVSRNFPGALCGMDLAFAGDLIPAAGMSSSSAVIVAIFLAMSAVNDLKTTPAYRKNIHDQFELAEYLGTVENGQSYRGLDGDLGVGTFGGSEDHTAIICSEPRKVGQFSYCPTRFDHSIEFPSGYVLMVAFSGVVAEKTGAAKEQFNRASFLVSSLVDLWRSQTGQDHQSLAEILASGPEAADKLRQYVMNSSGNQYEATELGNRLEHFISESLLLKDAVNALKNCQLHKFGKLVDRSMQIADELLDNQVVDTRQLAQLARDAGAMAASAFGAGFGGSVWAIVADLGTKEFLAEWKQSYLHAFPQYADQVHFFTTFPGPAAFELG